MTTLVPFLVVALAASLAFAQEGAPPRSLSGAHLASPTLEDAQRLFYSGRYEEASAMASALCSAEGLESCELRTSSLHFQIKLAMGNAPDRDAAWRTCATCPDLLTAFVAGIQHARTLARARLQRSPDDEAALFLLGKLNLNYVWLHVGTLGRRTGWDEYKEARASIEKVLEGNPAHLRARVAHAWIEYIVGTRMPRGTRWILGGGNKKRGLEAVRKAAGEEGSFFDEAEAGFALWDMQVREKDLAGAVVTARALARDFPDNRELVRFLAANTQ